MPEGDRFSQRAKSFIKEIGQDAVNSTDEEFAILKRLVEKRDREAAQVTVTPVSTVQHCITRSPSPEISIGTRIYMESNQGKMDPEPTELESPSAGTGIETPGQQCPPNEATWETGRNIANGYLLVGMGLNQVGDTSQPTECVGTRAGTATTPANLSNTIFRKTTSAASNITFLQQGHKPRDKTPSKENKQFYPDGKEEKPPLWNAAVMVSFFFLGRTLGRGMPAACASCFSSVRIFLSALSIVLSGDDFFSELKNMRGDADQVADVRNRRANIFLPINLLKMAKTNNTRFGRIEKALGYI